jgi:hypothetical protein
LSDDDDEQPFGLGAETASGSQSFDDELAAAAIPSSYLRRGIELAFWIPGLSVSLYAGECCEAV